MKVLFITPPMGSWVAATVGCVWASEVAESSPAAPRTRANLLICTRGLAPRR